MNAEGFQQIFPLGEKNDAYAQFFVGQSYLKMLTTQRVGIASLYKAFPPEEARRIARKLEVHYTPKHGSWLNIAEIELAALTKQCLGKRRIDSLEDLNSELEKWHTDRNTRQKGVNWQFTTDDARIKLKHLYPLVTF